MSKHHVPRKIIRKYSAFIVFVVGLVSFGCGCVINRLYQPVFPITFPGTPLLANQAKVCFTPDRRCQQLIIAQINKATQSIFVQAFSFTDRYIAEALAAAFRRNVDVKVLLDKSNKTSTRSAKDILISNQIPIRYDAPLGIAHNKIIIIDQNITLTGSYNYSTGAWQRNTENLLILDNAELSTYYRDNWQKRWDKSSDSLSFATGKTARKEKGKRLLRSSASSALPP